MLTRAIGLDHEQYNEVEDDIYMKVVFSYILWAVHRIDFVWEFATFPSSKTTWNWLASLKICTPKVGCQVFELYTIRDKILFKEI